MYTTGGTISDAYAFGHNIGLERSFEMDAADRGKALQLITEAAKILQKGSR